CRRRAEPPGLPAAAGAVLLPLGGAAASRGAAAHHHRSRAIGGVRPLDAGSHAATAGPPGGGTAASADGLGDARRAGRRVVGSSHDRQWGLVPDRTGPTALFSGSVPITRAVSGARSRARLSPHKYQSTSENGHVSDTCR